MYGYTKPESPGSVDSSEKTEQSQDDDLIKPDTSGLKEEKPEDTEEKPQLDDKCNADQKNGAKPEVRGIVIRHIKSFKPDRCINKTADLQEVKFLRLFGLTDVSCYCSYAQM
jgi:hypothetical protein